MARLTWLTALVLTLSAAAVRAEDYGEPAPAERGHGSRAWLRSFYQAYRDPVNYSGRAMYPGSRFGFYGYARPGEPVMPIPRSMRKTAAPTMYYWSQSLRAAENQAHDVAQEEEIPDEIPYEAEY